MKSTAAVKEVMKAKGVRKADLRRRLGLESNTMSQRLERDNITVKKLVDMLRALDYKLVIMPADGRIPDGGYEVE